ncbi:hypothetical protein RRG08_036642, partial [Elysia crispata]
SHCPILTLNSYAKSCGYPKIDPPTTRTRLSPVNYRHFTKVVPSLDVGTHAEAAQINSHKQKKAQTPDSRPEDH